MIILAAVFIRTFLQNLCVYFDFQRNGWHESLNDTGARMITKRRLMCVICSHAPNTHYLQYYFVCIRIIYKGSFCLNQFGRSRAQNERQKKGTRVMVTITRNGYHYLLTSL